MPHLKEFLHDNQIHFADLGVVLDVGFRVLALNHQIPARGPRQTRDSISKLNFSKRRRQGAGKTNQTLVFFLKGADKQLH